MGRPYWPGAERLRTRSDVSVTARQPPPPLGRLRRGGFWPAGRGAVLGAAQRGRSRQRTDCVGHGVPVAAAADQAGHHLPQERPAHLHLRLLGELRSAAAPSRLTPATCRDRAAVLLYTVASHGGCPLAPGVGYRASGRGRLGQGEPGRLLLSIGREGHQCPLRPGGCRHRHHSPEHLWVLRDLPR